MRRDDDDDLDIWDEESDEPGDERRPAHDDGKRDDDHDDPEPADDGDDDAHHDPDDDGAHESDDHAPDQTGAQPTPTVSAPTEPDSIQGRPTSVIVREGDCLHSLAAAYGLPVDELWNAPGNEALREQRTRAQLVPGDVVAIPPLRRRTVSLRTRKQHKIRLVDGRRCTLRLRLLRRGQPRADLPFTAIIDGVRIEGTTASDGTVELEVLTRATQGVLILHTERGDERHPLRIGSLRPTTTVEGLQARLNRLGLRCGPRDGDAGPRTRAAARAYRALADRGEAADAIDRVDALLEGTHD